MWILLCLMLLPSPVAAQPVTVFVTPPVRDGFVDATPALLDSVADVQKQVKGRKNLRLAASADTATLRLVIERRDVGNDGGMVGVPVGPSSVYLPVQTANIEAVLMVGDFEHRVRCSSGGWTDCAKRLVRDVEAWVVANRAEIERRAKGVKP